MSLGYIYLLLTWYVDRYRHLSILGDFVVHKNKEIFDMTPCSNNLVDETAPRKPHNVVATTEEGRRLPFPVLQEIYEAYFWFFKR